MRIALLQSAGQPAQVAANLAELAEAAASSAAGGADLLITPEMFLSGYHIGAASASLAEPADGELADAIGELARHHQLAIAYGYPQLTPEGVYNAVQLVDRSGQRVANYRKTHLYGDLDRSMFVAGSEPLVQGEFEGWRLGFLICYDVEFPELVRLHALAGTQLLVVPTSLMAPQDVIAQQVVPVRALENQLFIAYANRVGEERELTYCGQSVVAGPEGERARGGRAGELLLADIDLGELDRSRATHSYLADRRPDLYHSLTTTGDLA